MESFHLGTVEKHPHVRGEDSLDAPLPDRGAETPPRAWGRPVEAVMLNEKIRNTPTCVGKTASSPHTGHGSKKHPHVRGEDAASALVMLSVTETPPRAWGRLAERTVWFVARRNTPTCVGKTLPIRPRSR